MDGESLLFNQYRLQDGYNLEDRCNGRTRLIVVLPADYICFFSVHTLQDGRMRLQNACSSSHDCVAGAEKMAEGAPFELDDLIRGYEESRTRR